MKKSLFGYSVSEVDVMLNTLRDENESLNGTITTLKTQVKNNETNGAKANLLEADVKNLEEKLKQLSDEKNELLSQVASLSQEATDYTQINSNLKEQIALLQQQNETLNSQISELQIQNTAIAEAESKVDYSFVESLQAQLDSEKENKASLERDLADKYNELIAASEELDKAKIEIDQLKEELVIVTDSHDEQAVASTLELNENNQMQSSAVTLQAYKDMTRMRTEVMDFMHTQMREFYKLVNENSVRMNEVMEQRQTEYNKMVREFFKNATEFHANLSNTEDIYSKMTEYNFNLDKLSNSMNEIMNNFVEGSGAYMKAAEAELNNQNSSDTQEITLLNNKEVKPFVFKEIRRVNS
ncbi:MAG: hypothetical protein K0R05_541 [Anaerocolumna sp.]|jgi:chromosome segregation ATPase|nr:hypothetical protein [Anaerocolumna sp.]